MLNADGELDRNKAGTGEGRIREGALCHRAFNVSL
jgi:hypothetical protein